MNIKEIANKIDIDIQRKEDINECPKFQEVKEITSILRGDVGYFIEGDCYIQTSIDDCDDGWFNAYYDENWNLIDYHWEGI